MVILLGNILIRVEIEDGRRKAKVESCWLGDQVRSVFRISLFAPTVQNSKITKPPFSRRTHKPDRAESTEKREDENDGAFKKCDGKRRQEGVYGYAERCSYMSCISFCLFTFGNVQKGVELHEYKNITDECSSLI